MERAILRQAFHGHDLSTIRLDGKHGARLHGFSIQEHGAGAAIARIAAHMCSCKPELFTNKMHQQEPWFCSGLALFAVDLQADQFLFRHCALSSVLPVGNCYLPARSAARVSARLVSSLMRPVLYSAGPRKSELGCAASAASCAAWPRVAASSFLPRKLS